MRFAFGALGVVESASPEEMLEGFRGPFNKALTEELETAVAPMHPGGLAATFSHGGDASVVQEVRSRLHGHRGEADLRLLECCQWAEVVKGKEQGKQCLTKALQRTWPLLRFRINMKILVWGLAVEGGR